MNYIAEKTTMQISSPPADPEALAQFLKVLAEPNRLRLLHLLMEGIHCNCELGTRLDMAPNLISHHLRVLRKADLVDVERDLLDARWVYYSINRNALVALNQVFGSYFDPARIKERLPTCGPQGDLARIIRIEATS